MRYKLLGRSGLRVSELCLGAMTFGSDEGWCADKSESHAMFNAYVEAGGNFIDTADIYTQGESEKLVGACIAYDRERFVVATKYTNAFPGREDANAAGNPRKNMMQSLDASLKRLKADYVDLHWMHNWDFTTLVDEAMRALDDAVRAGKILYIGLSDALVWVRQRRTIPIPGARTLAQLQDNLGSLDVTLTSAHMQSLDDVSGIAYGHPYDLFDKEMVKVLATGGMGELIDNHRDPR